MRRECVVPPVWAGIGSATGSLGDVLRLLGGLGFAAPVGLALMLFAAPDLLGQWAVEGQRELILALAALVSGVSLTALVVFAYVRFRLERLVRVAERIAEGELAIEVVAPRSGLEGRLGRALGGISTAITSAQEAATVDRLTGVANRQALINALFTEVERASRYARPFSVAFVDIDHFKAVNDSYGHGVGDVVLRGVAQAIRSNLRHTDMIGRYGGEEFMLLLTETNVEDGAVLTEKLRHLVQGLRFEAEGNPELAVTISIGIAGGVGQRLRVDTLVRDADAAMYSAKSLGRNQTYIFAEPDDDARVPRAPISAAGRARAVEVGRAARDAAAEALTAVVAPLPHYRGQPSALIASIVTSMAVHLNLPEVEIDRLKIAALLHDVGKVAVPEEILEKPSTLSAAEWQTVVQHPRIGQVILEQATILKEAVPIILHHHERFSGHGYPYGLRGNDIPLGARIVAIADAYDAMIHDRPYKRAIGHEQAVGELRRHAGTQFDPDLVTLFCELFERSEPKPDPGILAMTAPHDGHRALAAMIAESSAGSTRRRRTQRGRSISPSTSNSTDQSAAG
jgi:diguanylate cyclase (GGDEF)-like protein